MRNFRLPHWAAFVVTVIASVPTTARAQAGGNETAVKQCIAILDEAKRLQCLKNLAFRDKDASTPSQPSDAPINPTDIQTSSSSHAIAGNWRLVRTPNPKGGKDAISIMHTAELSQSDPNFAGLLIRCSEHGPEALVVFVRPLPPRARPKISAAGKTYDGSVVSPGAEILLPGAGSDAQTRWINLPTLQINVVEDGVTTKGTVPLDGLQAALGTLNAACLSQ